MKNKKEFKNNNENKIYLFYFEDDVDNLILMDELNKLINTIQKKNFIPHLLLKYSLTSIKGLSESFTVEV